MWHFLPGNNIRPESKRNSNNNTNNNDNDDNNNNDNNNSNNNNNINDNNNNKKYLPAIRKSCLKDQKDLCPVAGI